MFQLKINFVRFFEFYFFEEFLFFLFVIIFYLHFIYFCCFQVENLSNEIITKDIAVNVVEMDRVDADKLPPVNSTTLYDKFPVPASVTRVKVLTIKDW
jgi:hypothetical protein